MEASFCRVLLRIAALFGGRKMLSKAGNLAAGTATGRGTVSYLEELPVVGWFGTRAGGFGVQVSRGIQDPGRLKIPANDRHLNPVRFDRLDVERGAGGVDGLVVAHFCIAVRAMIHPIRVPIPAAFVAEVAWCEVAELLGNWGCEFLDIGQQDEA